MTLLLTVTEQHILTLTANGYTRKEIAHHLRRSEHTIAAHYHHIKLKLTARTIGHAVAIAISQKTIILAPIKNGLDIGVNSHTQPVDMYTSK